MAKTQPFFTEKPVLPPYHKRGMAPYAFPAKLGPILHRADEER